MTLDDLGNLGEFVGAIAVVITLIYLALQIRQNSRQIRENTNSVLASAERDNAEASSDFLMSLAQNPQLAQVWRLGLAEPERLTEDEGAQFVMLMGAAFYRLEGPFRQYKRGLLSEDAWEPWDRLISRYLRSPAVLAWWTRRDVPFARSFLDYVDRRIPASQSGANVPTDEVLPPVWPDPGAKSR